MVEEKTDQITTVCSDPAGKRGTIGAIWVSDTIFSNTRVLFAVDLRVAG